MAFARFPVSLVLDVDGYRVLFGCLVALSICALFAHYNGPDLRGIPIVGPSGWFASYRGKEIFRDHACELVREGAERYPSGMFRVARLGWTVVVSGRQLMDELRSAPADQLSFYYSASEAIQTKHTLGPAAEYSRAHIHTAVIRSELTRNIATRFDDIRDEICAAFKDNVTFADGEVPAYTTVLSIVARTSNRYFVGLPLCRNEDYLDSVCQFARTVMGSAGRIKRWPSILRPLVGHVLSPFKEHYPNLSAHIGALVAQRLREDERLGAGKRDVPNDAISWLLKYENKEDRLEVTIMRIMIINFVATHTSTNMFTQALFQLAAQPEYIAPLRQEVEEVISRQGWTKASMRDMHKVDSFLREVARTSKSGCISLNRRVMKEDGFTFSNGVTLPKGTYVAASMHAAHMNPDVYPNPEVFDGFRFSRLRKKDPTKYQMVSTDFDYIQFGHGHHACPGRFFAANELKAMLAHLVSHYDVQLEGGSRVKPENEWIDEFACADTKAKVMFRKRVV
ncbi:cytochrome P450 [Schizophyllum commune]